MTSSAEFRTGLNNFWGSDPTLEGPKLCKREEGEGSRGGGKGVSPKILSESDPPSDWTWQGSNLHCSTALALRSS